MRVSDTMAVRQNTVRKDSGVFVPGRSIVEVRKCESVQVWKSTKSSISVQSHWILVLTAGYWPLAHLHTCTLCAGSGRASSS